MVCVWLSLRAGVVGGLVDLLGEAVGRPSRGKGQTAVFCFVGSVDP